MNSPDEPKPIQTSDNQHHDAQSDSHAELCQELSGRAETIQTQTTNRNGQTFSRTKLIEGVVVGVTAGLFLAAVEFLHDWYIERQQIHYINEIYSNSYASLCKTNTENRPSIELFAYYAATLNTLELAISNRSDRIPYDKLYEIRLLIGAAQMDVSNNELDYMQSFTIDKAGDIFYFNPNANVSWLDDLKKC